jgi:hypothetical protein
MMKFVGFDIEGEIWNEVVLDYHIDEMGFRLDMSSLRVFDNQWCIVIVVDDGGAARMCVCVFLMDELL